MQFALIFVLLLSFVLGLGLLARRLAVPYPISLRHRRPLHRLLSVAARAVDARSQFHLLPLPAAAALHPGGLHLVAGLSVSSAPHPASRHRSRHRHHGHRSLRGECHHPGPAAVGRLRPGCGHLAARRHRRLRHRATARPAAARRHHPRGRKPGQRRDQPRHLQGRARGHPWASP